jgi:hypothetical protein
VTVSSASALVPRAPEGSSLPELAVAPAPDAPSLSDLFTFMRDAEMRFHTLRMRLVDRTVAAEGERLEAHEIWLRHPGLAKVVTRFDELAPAGASRIWICDGATVTTYDTRAWTTSKRPLRGGVRGGADPALPASSRVYLPQIHLPRGSLADTFIHPHGFCRNVLVTGPLAILGTARLQGREIYLLRADHPRTTKVLIDRADHFLEVGVDRLTGMITLLIEHVGEQVTRRAEVTSLDVDAAVDEAVFTMRIDEGVRTIF